ncbi:helix-turn-helix transcriptional regulator [Streptomyces griseorubiginosus]|uniref:helix-turn-helix transcriptional regulator n=1 Tax=Streptomyces griseorubiginosus TaxID=67304 RepID=UPI002E81095A|nr:LuxR C-terminal-related transcriptional regulator [Streptomyces griseorubiginosus]WUB42810.1 LuxR C-terminal-related transcriptional regulator [Streptomyces griseorubiginosus]WUB51329.1 LuxR C-terminal-related transcriptional regulator [Streptomyces griseorubiginosus]
MTTFERDAKTLELPWPFTGRQDELELIRGSVAGGRLGIVVTGPAGRGKTRLVTEAVRGTDCARVAGTPETRGLPFAAFTHLLPESVSLHRAVQLLSGVRLLLVDDAHLLDDASAALVHQLAVHGRTRLVVVATDGTRAPGAISRLWTGELLPRLALEPLPREETAQLLAAGAGGLEALTVNRLYRLCQGDLRLLRELVGAVREQGLLERVADSAEWEWRGPVPVTATVRERTAELLERTGPGERETLDRLAFGEPLATDADTLDLAALEALEADGLVHVDDHGTARLAHPLHGPVRRAAAGRLRARRLARTPSDRTAALETETATLTRAIAETDVRAVPAPVGEWLVDEGTGIPAPHAAVRAHFARLRGELREAAAWAREGLRTTPDDRLCRLELTLATAQLGDPGSVVTWAGEPGSVAARSGDSESVAAQAGASGAVVPRADDPEPAVSEAGADHRRSPAPSARPGDPGTAVCRGTASGDPSSDAPAGPAGQPAHLTTDSGAPRPTAPTTPSPGQPAHLATDSGTPRPTPPTPPSAGAATWWAAARGDLDAALDAVGAEPYDAVRLGAPERAAGRLTGVFAVHADALARGDGPALDQAAHALEERGFLLFAAEAYAQAVRAHRDPGAARTSRTRAVALARRCQGARTPALAGLVLGELTARQRQIVTLAAAGLTNRQIAEKLTLSVRTVGNHLYSAYTRLGASDRDALPCLVELPEAQPA